MTRRKPYLQLRGKLLCIVEHEPVYTVFHELIQADKGLSM